MRKRNKIQKPYYLQKIGGDHILRFYFDNKSKHPLMGISRIQNAVSGHQMTSHPEKTASGIVKKSYIKFKTNPNTKEKNKVSYYRKKIKRNISIDRLSLKKEWTISKHDFKVLKNIDIKAIKNVRHAKN